MRGFLILAWFFGQTFAFYEGKCCEIRDGIFLSATFTHALHIVFCNANRDHEIKRISDQERHFCKWHYMNIAIRLVNVRESPFIAVLFQNQIMSAPATSVTRRIFRSFEWHFSFNPRALLWNRRRRSLSRHSRRRFPREKEVMVYSVAKIKSCNRIVCTLIPPGIWLSRSHWGWD